MLVSIGRRLVVLVPLLAFLFLTAPALDAQVLYGSVVGTVKDAQGAAIPAATIVITNKETNLTRETVTGAEGDYTVSTVPPGHYDVKVTLTGFREFVQTNVPVSAGQLSRVDVKLEIGALTETVTVASDAQLLQTDKSDLHTELRSKEITNLPLNQYRNYQALINLVPGRHAGDVPERADRHAGPIAADQHQWCRRTEQQHPYRWREQRQHLAPPSRGLRGPC